jgi:carboxylesterase
MNAQDRARPFQIRRGPTSCLLLHGLTGTPYEMRGLGEALVAAGVTVSCPLLPGHGTDPRDLAGTTWHDWERAALEAYETLTATHAPPFLCGLSMGASIAIRIAARRPTPGLIALSPAITLRTRLGPVLPWLARVIPFRPKTSDIKDPVAKASHPSYRMQSLAAAASLVELITLLPEEFPRITVPLLVIAAREDHAVDPAGAERLYREASSKDKRFVLLKDSYHVITVDREQETVRREVIAFVRRVAGI